MKGGDGVTGMVLEGNKKRRLPQCGSPFGCLDFTDDCFGLQIRIGGIPGLTEGQTLYGRFAQRIVCAASVEDGDLCA